MEIKYKIIETHPQLHSVVVRFYTNLLTEQLLCTYRDSEGKPILGENGEIVRCKYDLNLTFYQLPIPTGADLKTFILQYAPTQALDLEEKIISPSIDTSLGALTALVGVEEVGEVVTTPIPVLDAPVADATPETFQIPLPDDYTFTAQTVVL